MNWKDDLLVYLAFFCMKRFSNVSETVKDFLQQR